VEDHQVRQFSPRKGGAADCLARPQGEARPADPERWRGQHQSLDLGRGGGGCACGRDRDRRRGPRPGGWTYPVVAAKRCKDVCIRIAEELRNQYLLGYSPENGAAEGRWRVLTVRTTRPEVRLSTRSGYFAPAPRNGSRGHGAGGAGGWAPRPPSPS
jgi:hypothetical protein